MRGRSPAAVVRVGLLVGALTLGLPDTAAAQAVDQDTLVRDDLGAAAFSLAVAGWIVFLAVRGWWGRDRGSLRGAGDAAPSLELLDDPPVVVEALRSGGTAPVSTIGLVLLDLARRGYLDIIETSAASGRDWRFVRRDRPPGELEPYENAVSTRLLVGSNDARASDLVRWAADNRNQARVFVDRVRRYVGREMAERGYLKEPSRTPVVANLVTALVVAVVGLAALVSGALVGALAVVSALAQGSLSRSLRRRTAAGAERAEEWFAVARGLQAVDEAAEAPASSAEEWDRLLVYAVALGVGETFVGALRRRDDVDDDALATWFTGEGDHLDRLQSAVRFPARLGQAFGGVLERMPTGAAARMAPVKGRPPALSWRPGPSRPAPGED